MSFLVSIKGMSDDWMVSNRGATVLVNLLRRSGMDEKTLQTLEEATYFNGIEIDLNLPNDLELSRTVLKALNSANLDKVDAALKEHYQQLGRLLDGVLTAHPENKIG